MFFVASVAELLQDEFNPRFNALKARADELSREVSLPDLLAEARALQVSSRPEIVSGEDALELAYQKLKEEG